MHRTTGELEAAIKAYIDATNAEPKPFRRTKSADDILVAINRFCKRTVDEHHSTMLKTSESGLATISNDGAIGRASDYRDYMHARIRAVI
ncbi:MAG: hypothetical protein ACR2KT_03880 [Methylocella sp.]|nr:MAG: hypothetical protein DLM68_10830 [Hyphomicrobiales bacterium]